MKINTITNQFYINNNKINFSAKNNKKNNPHPQIPETAAQTNRLVPAMMALAALTTLNSCTESDIRYADLRNFKNECLEEFLNDEDSFSRIDEKTFQKKLRIINTAIQDTKKTIIPAFSEKSQENATTKH